ncbi:ammonium transporter family domain-containing protein [Ditylenchus destructor]|uniref:Ammonium transporter family domain-containing protein n=1 Tax=Ditylenchus destructor TaxID=166010 RepID=A0AAD4MT21_9BILA|nr:ammonium transporter family domain-containing protein [Ditylenchus destructor]
MAMAVAPKTIWNQHQLTIILTLIQIIFLIVFILFSEHSAGAQPGRTPEIEAPVKYTDFQDIHLALVLGFAFLIAFLRRYSYASFGFTLLLTALTIEWALIIRGLASEEFANSKNGRFPISIYSLVKADFTAAVVLIAFGALAGKLSPVQYLIVALAAGGASIGNECLVLKSLGIQDVGGSAVVHLFGAIFGIVAAKILSKPTWKNQQDYGSVYHSDLISFIGAGVLWVFFPAFNAVNTVADARYRAIINSYVALVASAVAAFLTSQFLSKIKHFNIRHVVSASLAGGVALGATANILLHPWHAFVVGSIAGIVSILSFVFITPKLDAKWGVHDSRGVLSLHGIPGFIGIVASAAFLALYPDNTYPVNSKIIAAERDNLGQAGIQLLAIIVTIAVAAIAGVITGFILNVKIWNQVLPENLFSDNQFFALPEDFDFTSRVIGQIDHVEISKQPVLPVGPTTSGTQEEMINLTSAEAIAEETKVSEVTHTQETPAV